MDVMRLALPPNELSHSDTSFTIRMLLHTPSKRPVLKREPSMIRKLKTGKFRLYSRKRDPKTGKRRNLGTFSTRRAAEKHERAVQYFKRVG
ncbi:MAG TPA: hypothetical protein VHC42_05110 [Rhizomicrobium sp.]|nr:hypothetical protein [Rhizomicrobium sp.]